MKKVIDIWSKNETMIDESTRVLHSYDNAKKRAIYNAAEVDESGKRTGFYVDYVVEEKVTDVKARLETFGSPIHFLYSEQVGFNSTKNDPENVYWNSIVEWAEHNQDKVFYKNGNLRKRITLAKIKSLCK